MNECGATHEMIDYGSPCIYLEGHQEANIPHTTRNGLWWFDTVIDEAYDESNAGNR